MSTTASNSTDVGNLNMTPQPEEISSTCSTSNSGQSPSIPSTSSGESHTCPYKDCGKSFSKKYNLKAHLRLHTGEQPFECERPDCRKKFKWRSSLSSHTVWHSRKDKAATPAEVSAPPAKKAAPHPKSDSSRCTPKPSGMKTKQKESLMPRAKKTSTAHTSTSSKPVKITPATTPSKKKRPRTESVKPKSGKASSPAFCKGKGVSPSLSPSASQVFSCVSSDDDGGVESSTSKAPPRQGDRHESKRRKVSKQGEGGQSECVSQAEDVASVVDAGEEACLPGSPVASDDGLSEHSIELDIFPCDMLPPLMGGTNDGIGLDEGGVEVMLNSEEAVDMFGVALPSCGALNGLDTRFGPFDLDNLQTFCLSKAEEF